MTPRNRKSEFRAIVFDLGGVLIDWDPRRLYRKVFATDQEVHQFLEHICTNAWNAEQDAGRSLEEGTRILVSKHPQFRTEIEAYYGRWEEMLGGQFDQSVAVLEALGARGEQQLLALTNFSAETYPIAQDRYPFLARFEDVLVSGVVGLKKPDPRIYRMLLERHGLSPQEVLFIDDQERNILAAAKLGMSTVHCQDPAAIAGALRRHGLWV